MNKEFLIAVQRRTAMTSVGPSTARSMGPSGTISAARTFFEKFDLRSVRAQSHSSFLRRLDQATEELRCSLPKDARYWGSSRKFINIFLRNSLYNRYLCDHFRLHGLEPWLEVPLDSHVAKGLMQEDAGRDLPSWKTVIGLKRQDSDEYQEVASLVAAASKIARVHLDLKYWRGRHVVRQS